MGYALAHEYPQNFSRRSSGGGDFPPICRFGATDPNDSSCASCELFPKRTQFRRLIGDATSANPYSLPEFSCPTSQRDKTWKSSDATIAPADHRRANPAAKAATSRVYPLASRCKPHPRCPRITASQSVYIEQSAVATSAGER